MKIYLFIFSLLSSGLIFSQHKQYEHIHEVGLGVGAFNYTGDLSEHINFRDTKPGANFFYRYNFKNEASVLRLNIGGGRLGADEKNSSDLRRVARGASFLGTVLETSLVYEYDFFNFRDIDNIYFMSPYLYGGIGGTSFFSDTNLNSQFVSIPFGTGIKFRLKGGWNIGLEMGARKNFTDALDSNKNETEFSSSIGTDWHYFAGINVSYTFYRLICPKCNNGH